MLDYLTRARAKNVKTCLILFLTWVASCNPLFADAQGITLYTPYTKISVPPGESINYDIDIINNGKSVSNAEISVKGLPKGWTYLLKSGGWSLGQISVLPKEHKTVNMQLQVPLQVNKGTYKFFVTAKGIAQLPLTVVVSKQGTFKAEFTTPQSNMQGAANSVFTYSANLKNGTSSDQVYSLNAELPAGWNIAFKADYKQVSSINIEANKGKDITIEVDPPDQTPAGTYKIPVIAVANGVSANLTLDLVVSGSYAMELSTPTGLLSTKTTAGEEKHVEMVVKNTGSAPLKNIELQSTAPTNWEVYFEPKKIEGIAPGNSAQVFAVIKPDKKAIAGDYIAALEAKTPEVTSKADLRISVETSLWAGWFGLMIILLVVWSVYYLFKKYGRR